MYLDLKLLLKSYVFRFEIIIKILCILTRFDKISLMLINLYLRKDKRKSGLTRVKIIYNIFTCIFIYNLLESGKGKKA